MKSVKKKVLFISHDASRTGAPIVLLHLLNFFKEKNEIDFEIFLKGSGEMTAQFVSIAKTYFPLKKNIVVRVFEKISRKFFNANKATQLPTALRKNKYDLIYLNTVVCLDLTPLLNKTFSCPIICHVHENDYTIKFYCSELVTKENLVLIDRFIAVSESTKQNLIHNYNIALNKITLVYECISIKQTLQPTHSKNKIKDELGLHNEFIIGGSGLTSWRKGTDLFIQLAVNLKQLIQDNTFKLIWVGVVSDEVKAQFDYEAERLQISDKLIFTGSKNIPQNYFQIFDVFALTSREDPFPLVALETATLGKPIICFNNAGGIPELIDNDKSGIIIPYGNVEEMAKQIVALKNKPERVMALGSETKKIVANFDVEIIGNQVLSIMKETMK